MVVEDPGPTTLDSVPKVDSMLSPVCRMSVESKCDRAPDPAAALEASSCSTHWIVVSSLISHAPKHPVLPCFSCPDSRKNSQSIGLEELAASAVLSTIHP
jgi:hypothetical protein